MAPLGKFTHFPRRDSGGGAPARAKCSATPRGPVTLAHVVRRGRCASSCAALGRSSRSWRRGGAVGVEGGGDVWSRDGRTRLCAVAHAL